MKLTLPEIAQALGIEDESLDAVHEAVVALVADNRRLRKLLKLPATPQPPEWGHWNDHHYERWDLRNELKSLIATVIDRDSSGNTGWYIGLRPLKSTGVRSDKHGPETGAEGRRLAEAAARRHGSLG